MHVPSPHRFDMWRLLLAGLAAGVAGTAHGDAGLPPPVVAQFTRAVQPLLLNKCAQGACHGGPQATAASDPPALPTAGPWKIIRLPGGQSPDRATTLANLTAFLAVVGPDRDPQPLVKSLATRHPAAAPSGAFVAGPLTVRERITLETWLATVQGAEAMARGAIVDEAVVPAGYVDETGAAAGAAPPRANRLQALLEAAANPPELPPPQEPQGIIFKKDDLSDLSDDPVPVTK
jgi:hypothetical protein